MVEDVAVGEAEEVNEVVSVDEDVPTNEFVANDEVSVGGKTPEDVKDANEL